MGLDLTHRLTDRVALLVGGDVEFLRGAQPAGTGPTLPDLSAWHYALGVKAQLLEPRTTYWRLGVGAGLREVGMRGREPQPPAAQGVVRRANSPSPRR